MTTARPAARSAATKVAAKRKPAAPGSKSKPAAKPAAEKRAPSKPAPAPDINVLVSYGAAPAGLPTEAEFQGWVAAVLQGRRKLAEVSIHVVDAEEGQQLNLKYRHKDYPTNVLSFPADLPGSVPHPLLGDVVLCAPVVAKEAAAQGKSVAHHYAHLTVHGVLHLIGIHHETVSETRAMEAIETQVLAAIGIPDPYADR